jgi:hypothetical protein
LIRDFRSLTRYLAGFPVYPRASQHGVFTILKQRAGKSEGSRNGCEATAGLSMMKGEGESLVRWHSIRFNLNV